MDESTKTLEDLIPDPQNRRKHTIRNVDMIRESINKVGTARSIVIDENDEILAGNATVEAAEAAGLKKVRVIDTDGSEVIAVRRSGLTEEQKRDLAIYDNRTSELSDWDAEQLLNDIENGMDLSSIFDSNELEELLSPLEAFNPKLHPGYSNDGVTHSQIDNVQQKLDGQFSGREQILEDITCPHCAETFQIQVRG